MLNKIRIVLIATSHPGNIGSAARAMKTMGLKNLYLVAPLDFPHPKAWEMASGAGDVLDNAIICETLEEAVADCDLVVGTSARMRALPWPMKSPREVAEQIAAQQQYKQVALVFGREHSGLTNEELQQCRLLTTIDANPEYSSLNLAAAVQVISYECRMASLQDQSSQQEWDQPLAKAGDLEKFFVHMESVLTDLDFLKKSAPRKLMPRMRRLFLRADPDEMEINILRGMLTAIQNKKES